MKISSDLGRSRRFYVGGPLQFIPPLPPRGGPYCGPCGGPLDMLQSCSLGSHGVGPLDEDDLLTAVVLVGEDDRLDELDLDPPLLES